MKKIILTAVLAVGAFAAQAQDKKFHYGAKIGANLTTLTGDIEEADVLPGFHAGVFAEYRFTDTWSVQPEVMFSTQGAITEYNEDVFGDDYEFEAVTLNYLNVPVLVKYHFAKIKGLSVNAGPQIGILLKAEQEYEINGEGGTTSHEEDIKDSLKPIDVSIVAGAEYELPVGVFFTLRGMYGLTNIMDEGDDKVYNAGLQLSAGYRF